MMLTNGIEEMREKKEFPTHTWSGFYPYYYLSKKGILCPGCANENIENCLDPENEIFINSYNVNWEDEFLYCDHCSRKIESAYGVYKMTENTWKLTVRGATLLLKFASGKELYLQGDDIETFFSLEDIPEEEQDYGEGIFLDLSGYEEIADYPRNTKVLAERAIEERNAHWDELNEILDNDQKEVDFQEE
ncbi:hypothetical protein MSSAC_2402 [Methanosarcina siciliae C2J]|uniref:Uncharacterized protein n=1 Tax=Methanosarcina siciliae C2J TaxID=1434118 RepID=A0A0E3PPR7_9EURY|nr:hypothetical protein [Methanosarcina siciliae]AKB36992.1 hypothetical protein MSSAC_2402 [Methanosarcina siciliae C2J]